jgi:hypothetical protein
VDARKLGRFLANALQLFMFAKPDLHEVLVQRVG